MSDEATGTINKRTGVGERLSAQLAGNTLEARIDSLFQQTFVGSRIGQDTEAWNQVHGFKEKIKTLIGETDGKPD